MLLEVLDAENDAEVCLYANCDACKNECIVLEYCVRVRIQMGLSVHNDWVVRVYTGG